MLALDNHLLYVDEPFNVQTGLRRIQTPFPYVNTLHPGAASEYTDIVQEFLDGNAQFKASTLRPPTKNPLRQAARELLVSRESLAYKLQTKSPLKQRYLIKDPTACFLSEYLYRQFHMDVVIIMRHPASTIASYRRLGWQYDMHTLLRENPALRHDHLEKVFRGVNTKKLTAIEAWSYLWLAIYSVLETYRARNSGMHFVTHEALSLNPCDTFADLYGQLGLNFSSSIRQKVAEHTSSENPTGPTDNQPHVLHRNSAANISRWKGLLEPDEVRTIKAITGPIADNYYSALSWEIT
jgi:hypothetical protein